MFKIEYRGVAKVVFEAKSNTNLIVPEANRIECLIPFEQFENSYRILYSLLNIISIYPSWYSQRWKVCHRTVHYKSSFVKGTFFSQIRWSWKHTPRLDRQLQLRNFKIEWCASWLCHILEPETRRARHKKYSDILRPIEAHCLLSYSQMPLGGTRCRHPKQPSELRIATSSASITAHQGR